MDGQRTPRLGNVKCKEHKGMKPAYYCCGQLICHDLCFPNHSTHTYLTITQKSSELRGKLSDLQQTLKDIHTGLNENLWCFESTLRKNSEELQKNKNSIHQRIKEVISYLKNTIEPALKTDCENRHKRVEKILNNNIDECNTVSISIQHLRDSCAKLKDYNSELETVRVGSRIEREIQRYVDDNAQPKGSLHQIEISEFISPQTLPDKDTLRKILGTFNDSLEMDSDWSTSEGEKFKLVKKFRWKQKGISLTAVEDDCVWIHGICSGGPICKVSHNGCILQEKQNKKERKIDQICASKSTNSWVTDTESCSIKILKEDGKMEHKFHVNPFHPFGICSAQSGDAVWVCLAEKESFIPGLNGRTMVAKMSSYGHKLCEIESQANKRYFNFPYRCVENINQDLWVVDRLLLEAKGQVIIFDKTGHPKGGYIGTGSDKDFDPRDICINNIGNVIVSDCANNAIHILNSDGKLERVLKTDTRDLIQPLSVSCTESDKIWISFCSGKVAIIKPI